MEQNNSLEKLISSAAKGNARAQLALFDRYSKRCKRYCLRLTRNDEDADEAMQDGFYRFFKQLHIFNYLGEGELYAYLKKTMAYECLSQARSKKVYPLLFDGELPDVAVDPEVFSKFSAAEIDKLLLQIPPCHGIVFNLVELEGYDHKTIAEMLEITETASRIRLFKAKKLLKKLLESKGHYHATESK